MGPGAFFGVRSTQVRAAQGRESVGAARAKAMLRQARNEDVIPIRVQARSALARARWSAGRSSVNHIVIDSGRSRARVANISKGYCNREAAVVLVMIMWFLRRYPAPGSFGVECLSPE